MVLSNRQMSVSCAEVEFIVFPPKAHSPCLQRACKVRDARSLQSKYAAAASSASGIRWWHRARILEARLSWSRLALNLHLPAAQTVPATHVGGAPSCAARTCLLRSRRRRSARSSYCTLFNNHCVPSACSCVSQNTHRRRASAVPFSAFRLLNPTQTRRREVHGGLWLRLNIELHCRKNAYLTFPLQEIWDTWWLVVHKTSYFFGFRMLADPGTGFRIEEATTSKDLWILFCKLYFIIPLLYQAFVCSIVFLKHKMYLHFQLFLNTVLERSLWKTRIHIFKKVNIMAANDVSSKKSLNISSNDIDPLFMQYASLSTRGLRHLGRDKMAVIFQTTLLIEFS